MAEVVKPKLNWRQRDILTRMAEGWQPFPMQFAAAAKTLLRRELVSTGWDEKGNQILRITPLGRQAVTD